VRQRNTLADIIAAEQAQVAAGADGCAKHCDDGCHGDLICVRAAHPHDPNAEMVHPVTGVPVKGNVVPHVGYGPDGGLVQWTCLPGDHDGLTAETRPGARAAAAAAERIKATRALVDSIDPQLLVELLRFGEHP
jgi:hypothetical protein